MLNLKTLWHSHYKNTPPLGYCLREDFADRWLRLHALPLSKRYADNDEERQIIIDRANTVANDLFAGDELFWLLSTRAIIPPDIIDHSPMPIVRTTYGLQLAFESQNLNEAIEDRLPLATFARSLTWKEGDFDGVFQKVADEIDYGILFVTSDFKSILAPYDGGFDLILSDKEGLKRERSKYRSWLSDHSAGL